MAALGADQFRGRFAAGNGRIGGIGRQAGILPPARQLSQEQGRGKGRPEDRKDLHIPGAGYTLC
jgi:hypothetical protein